MFAAALVFTVVFEHVLEVGDQQVMLWGVVAIHNAVVVMLLLQSKQQAVEEVKCNLVAMVPMVGCATCVMGLPHPLLLSMMASAGIAGVVGAIACRHMGDMKRSGYLMDITVMDWIAIGIGLGVVATLVFGGLMEHRLTGRVKIPLLLLPLALLFLVLVRRPSVSWVMWFPTEVVAFMIWWVAWTSMGEGEMPFLLSGDGLFQGECLWAFAITRSYIYVIIFFYLLLIVRKDRAKVVDCGQ